jgi:hypothetical protein
MKGCGRATCFQVDAISDDSVLYSLQLLHRYVMFLRSRDSVTRIANGYVLDDPRVGIQVPVGSRIFSSPRRPAGVNEDESLLQETGEISTPV